MKIGYETIYKTEISVIVKLSTKQRHISYLDPVFERYHFISLRCINFTISYINLNKENCIWLLNIFNAYIFKLTLKGEIVLLYVLLIKISFSDHGCWQFGGEGTSSKSAWLPQFYLVHQYHMA